MRKNQQGFNTVERLLILIIAGLVGFIGWYVYHNKHNSRSTSNIASSTQAAGANKTYTDGSKTYTLSYPSTWTTTKYKPGNAASVAPLLDPMETVFIPANSPAVGSNLSTPNTVGVIIFKSSDTKAILSAYLTGDGTTTPQNLTINGYSAMYQQAISTRFAPTYTDDVYAVTHNDITLLFQFREKQGSDSVGALAFDATGSAADYTALVKSVIFLN
ncbi:hypothetical protein BVY00_01735 [bacterium G20]|nr:hypothetical protein BVY00_01735 [bacterium G20]